MSNQRPRIVLVGAGGYGRLYVETMAQRLFLKPTSAENAVKSTFLFGLSKMGQPSLDERK